MTGLTPGNVDKVLHECLIPAGTKVLGTSDEFVTVAGIMRTLMFSPSAIEGKRDEIKAMLRELPDAFRKEGGGGGWSFLNACNDRHGNLWTGDHAAVEALFMLGMAAGFVTELLPRDMWPSLPGGMPYYLVDV